MNNTPEDHPRRCCIYCRVSTQEQAREGLSLPLQEARCREAAEASGYTVADTYIDDGYSGRSSKRPAYRAMLAKLADYDCVYVYRLDRLSRSVRDLFNVLYDLSQAGVVLKAVFSTVDLTTAMGRAMVGVSAVFAALEAELTQERVQEAMEDIVHQGRNLSFPPYGYTREAGPDGKPIPRGIMYPDPETAPVVRRIYEEYAEGISPVNIARGLIADGIPPARGGTIWRDSQIRRMLARVTYLGRVAHSRTGHTQQGQHPAIIDRELWERVQARRRQNRARPPRSRSTPSLSPLLTCLHCGSSIRIRYSRDRPLYTCSANALRPPELRHAPVYISAAIMEGYVWLLVDALWAGELDMLRRPRPRRRSGQTRCRKLRDRIADIESQVQYLVEVGRHGGMTPAQVAEQTRPLLADVDMLERELARLTEDVPLVPEAMPGKAVLRRLREGSYTKQRDFLGRVFARIAIGDETLAMWLHGVDEPITLARQRFCGTKPHDLQLIIVE